MSPSSNQEEDKSRSPNSLHKTIDGEEGPDNTSIASSESQQNDSRDLHQVKPLNRSESPVYPADSPYTAFPPHVHRQESHNSSKSSRRVHEPPNAILGPLADLERSISSFEDLEGQRSHMTRQQSAVTSASKNHFEYLERKNEVCCQAWLLYPSIVMLVITHKRLNILLSQSLPWLQSLDPWVLQLCCQQLMILLINYTPQIPKLMCQLVFTYFHWVFSHFGGHPSVNDLGDDQFIL